MIPGRGTKILICCNNNFEGQPKLYAVKELLYPREYGDIKAEAPKDSDPSVQTEPIKSGKPLYLALNVPTYITLYGYGYRNVYELDELVSFNDPRIQFEGSSVKPVLATPTPETK